MIPINVRRGIYITLAVVGLALGAIQVGYSSIALPAPPWLIVASAVYGFLGGSGGILAVLNTADGDIDPQQPLHVPTDGEGA